MKERKPLKLRPASQTPPVGRGWASSLGGGFFYRNYGEFSSGVDTVTKTPKRLKTACPVKLTNSRIVHNLEEDVYTTVTNVSQSDITAISLGAAHTDKFGDTWQPYNTNLTSETGIKRGHAVPMH